MKQNNKIERIYNLIILDESGSMHGLEKMCVDGVIISHTYKDFENPIAIGDNQ